MSALKIIALDLDGTLLDSQKRLSSRNCEALSRAAARGAVVVPTTGRFFGLMPEAVRGLEFVRYAITVNGAQVFDRQTESAIVREEIPLETAVRIMSVLDGYDIIYDCYRQNWGWMTAALQNKAETYATDVHYLKMVREFRHPVPELKQYLRDTADAGGVQKIMLFSPLADRELKINTAIRLELAEKFPEIKVTSSCWNDLELNLNTANKGMALKRFAEHLGMTLENCIAFGDGLNDLSMIEAAGVGVAMANAVEAVKAAAGYHTATNDEDGVALALEHFGLA